MTLDSSENDFRPTKRYRAGIARQAMPTLKRPWMARSLNPQNKRNFLQLPKLYPVFQEASQVELESFNSTFSLFIKLARKVVNFTPTKGMYFYMVDHGNPLDDELYQEFVDKQINSKG